jgi:UDP-N-acetylmuramoylalanine--D-glutamate ligase
MMNVTGKRVLVVGFARSGKAVARCFSQRGAVVTVSDSRPPWAFEAEIRELMAHKIGLELGQHREETFLQQDLIVISPGVYPEPPALRAARQQGIPIIPEIEAASWFLESRLLGITGTNGKTTTTALLGKMLEASGLENFVGGNIGVPLIAAVGRISPDALVVAELSSFQLEIIRDFRPHVAVLLNLKPNHLDRHPSFEAYGQAKAQIFRNQTEGDLAILNADDPAVMNLAPEIRSRKMFFSRKLSLPDGVFVSNGTIRYRVGNLERVLLETREVPLRGEFNIENVLAAAAAACAVGADFEALRRAVREFKAVEHRLEFVREIRGVEFFNDSKATSVDAAANALSAFDRGVHLILGGKDKGASYAPLRRLVAGRVRCVYLIGAAADRIAKQLSGAAELVQAGDLETALREAFRLAERGDVVLLSPACASFDQFQDYEHRGRVFKELVEKLAEEVARGHVNVPQPAAPDFAPPTEVQPESGTEIIPESPEAAPEEVSEAVESPASSEPAAVESERVEPLDDSSAEAVQELSAPSGEAAKAPSSATEPRELVYVYEVAAEEVSYPEADRLPAGDEFEPIVPDELRPPESLADDALPFEVRETASQGNGGLQEPVKKRAAKSSKKQKRLPGI